MSFSDKFISGIVDDPLSSIVRICKAALDSVKNKPLVSYTEEDYNFFLEAYSLIQSIFENKILEYDIVPAILNGSKMDDCGELYSYLSSVMEHFVSQETNVKVEAMTSRFKNKLGTGFVYEFTDGDIDRVQTLINELREEISKSDIIQEDHKSRLLKRLEKLQAEMHKRMSDLDKFWGFIGDSGIVIGKFGTDVKPVVDRMREIADIIWRTQAKAEELPSGTENPMLPAPSDDLVDTDK